jgi:hypothetical protein
MKNEDGDDAFRDSQKFTRMDNETFDDYVSVNSYLATMGVNTMKELRESVYEQRVWKEKEGKTANPNTKL